MQIIFPVIFSCIFWQKAFLCISQSCATFVSSVREIYPTQFHHIPGSPTKTFVFKFHSSSSHSIDDMSKYDSQKGPFTQAVEFCHQTKSACRKRKNNAKFSANDFLQIFYSCECNVSASDEIFLQSKFASTV